MNLARMKYAQVYLRQHQPDTDEKRQKVIEAMRVAFPSFLPTERNLKLYAGERIDASLVIVDGDVSPFITEGGPEVISFDQLIERAYPPEPEPEAPKRQRKPRVSKSNKQPKEATEDGTGDDAGSE